MPKVASEGTNNAYASSKNPLPTLKRYQACHQCRRRKLKCDAKRPCCSTCIKSHAYAVSHAGEGAVLSPEPECTYDEVPNLDAEGSVLTKKQIEKLEDRIGELEGLLQERDVLLRELQLQQPKGHSASSPSGSPFTQSSTSPYGVAPVFQVTRSAPPLTSDSIPFGSMPAADTLAGLDATQFGERSTLDNILSGTAYSNTGSPGPSSSENYMVPRSWPSGLPTPEVLRHLVEAFFAFFIHGRRLFHMANFMASLELPPSDPRFPAPCILHAMCAVGSLYTTTISRTQMVHSNSDDFPYEYRDGKWRRMQGRSDVIGDGGRPETFAEQQARYAKSCIDLGLSRIEWACVPAQLILSWWYMSQARWTEAFMGATVLIRLMGPCNLNSCYTTSAITHYKPPSIIDPAKSVVEDEVRRNTFWLGYAIERQQGIGNGWNSSIDDLDVAQLLPLRGDQYEDGVLVLPSERQWSYQSNLLAVHPSHQTDSFILYIKATMMCSRVKTYNLRFRWRYYLDDDMNQGNIPASYDPSYYDPRNTQAFRNLDQLVSSFKTSFPPQYKYPIKDDTLDPYLCNALTGAHLAQMLLHEPHAKPENPNCLSARKALDSSRAIVSIVYMITATNYDVSLLDTYLFSCWFVAGRVLIRFLKAAMDSNNHALIIQLQMEVPFLQTMLAKAGERIPLAFRYSKMLQDTLSQVCGDVFNAPMLNAMPPRNMQPTYEEDFRYEV